MRRSLPPVALARAAPLAAASAPALPQGDGSPGAKEDAPPIPPPKVSVTRHSGTFGGQRINYVATAGETYLKAADGTPRAAIFSTSYVKEPRDPNRPITFLFNGGPGSGDRKSTRL